MSEATLAAPARIVKIPNGDPGVEYREVERWIGYAVGDDGSVWSRRWKVRLTGKGVGRGFHSVLLDKWKKLRGCTNNAGYRQVELHDGDGPGKTLHVHRLVLIAFRGPAPDGMECCHNDGNPSNCALYNLRWDTQSANAFDRTKHGRSQNKVLTSEQVSVIKRRFSNGESSTVIARDYGVTVSTALCIKKGKTWKHVPNPS